MGRSGGMSQEELLWCSPLPQPSPMNDRPLVIQTEDLDPEPAAWLAERCRLVVCPFHHSDALARLLPGADGLVVRTYTRVDRTLLERAPRLRVVGRAGVALENIDLQACRARGVEVVHTPDANTQAVVEFVVALLLDALRPRLYLDQAVSADLWHDLRRRYVADRELRELTLGIWGLGRIGSGVARVAGALGMRVIYNDLLDFPPPRRFGAEPVSVDDLLGQADVLSIHVDDRPTNRHLLDAAALARLRDNVVIVNTSRGFVVDRGALAEFLGARPRALALLDVHDPDEPIPPDDPLLGLPNARLTPHLASGTASAKRRMSWVVRDVWRVLCGQAPEHPAPRDR